MLEGLASFALSFLVKLLLDALDRRRAQRDAEERGAAQAREEINQGTVDAERRAAQVPDGTRDNTADALDHGMF